MIWGEKERKEFNEEKQKYKNEGFAKVGERLRWFDLFCDLLLNQGDIALYFVAQLFSQRNSEGTDYYGLQI